MPSPVPPDSSFASDNAAGVLPEVLAAIEAANDGPALAYGEDRWTAEAARALDDRFGRHVESLLCWGGTGANVVGLASVLEPHQAVITPETAHIVVDECGAPVRFTGCSVLTVPGSGGKLVPEALAPYLHWLGTEHHPQPAVVSISQATEMGTVYSPEEIAAISEVAHANSMLVHLDGARIANALAATSTDLARMVVDTGVDLMTFGMTKNGAMYGEVVVFVRPELDARARFVRKQAGQLSSKSRFIAAQLLALLEDDRWLRHAAHANDMAARLAARAERVEGVRVAHPPQVNSLFVHLPARAIPELQQWSFFWEWDLTQSLVRWMTSFATSEQDVDRFVAGVDELLAAHR